MAKNSVTNKAVRTKFLSDRHASLEEKVFEDDHMVGSCGAWTSVGAFALTSGGSRANKGRGPYWHLFFLLSALSARKHPKLVPCLRFMGCRQVSLSLHWTGVWSVFLHHFGEDSCIMVFPEHRIPGVSFTQVAKTRLRLFSASKDALRIWSVKSATVSRKSQWRYFEALLHLSLGLGFSTISGWYFLWWRCIFKASIS